MGKSRSLKPQLSLFEEFRFSRRKCRWTRGVSSSAPRCRVDINFAQKLDAFQNPGWSCKTRIKEDCCEENAFSVENAHIRRYRAYLYVFFRAAVNHCDLHRDAIQGVAICDLRL